MATESFFSNASLAYLASAGAGKDGKAYSIKPTDGTGDFTFSRGSNLTATRVGPTGLIEKGRENLLLQSNQFDTSPWTGSASTLSGQSGYDGTSDAWLITKSGTFDSRRQLITNSGVATFSVYAKSGSYNWMLLHIEDAAGDCLANFDLSSGTLGSLTNGITSKIEDVGNGWYRCSATFNRNVTDVRIYPSESGSYTGTSGSIYIQDAQLEVGLAATEYIESGASTGKAGLLENEPRFDYSGGATCPSLLLEPQRVQLVQYSEYFEGTGWSLAGSAIIAKSSSTNPMGQSFCYELQTSFTGYLRALINGKTGSSTHSIYVKRGGSNPATHIRLTNNNTAAWNTGTSVKHLLTDDWVRIDTQDGITTSSAYFIIGNVDESNVLDSDCAGTCLIWGAQVEDGSYPTSYIPNHSGGSATRTRDNLTSTPLSINGLFGPTSGSIFMEFTNPLQGLNNNWFSMTGVAAGAIAYMRVRGYWQMNIAQLTWNPNPNLGSTDGATKIAVKWGDGVAKLFVDGQEDAAATYTGGDINMNGTLGEINGFFDFAENDANFKQILFFPEALSDADLQSLTTL